MVGSPLTIEMACWTNMLPNSPSSAAITAPSPTRLTAEATPRFHP